jgi:dienelactone hydrolase
VVGFSHGGTTALFVASSAVVERLGARPFARAVAFYP